jgi:hypothetical protein
MDDSLVQIAAIVVDVVIFNIKTGVCTQFKYGDCLIAAGFS